MMDRRTLLATVLAPILPRLAKPVEYKVGDWIRVVAVPVETPRWASSRCPYMRRIAWTFRKCFGRQYQVVYVDDGCPGVDLGLEFAVSPDTVCDHMTFQRDLVVRIPVPESQRLTAHEQLQASRRILKAWHALPPGDDLDTSLTRVEYKVGDRIQVIYFPDWVYECALSERTSSRNFAEVYQKCLGKRYEVLLLDDDNGVYFHEDGPDGCVLAHLHLEGDSELSDDGYQWLKKHNGKHGGYYVHLPSDCVILFPFADPPEFNTWH
jgi:hypothetical protein